MDPVDDEISPAFDEGYSPRWYLWNGTADHEYTHNGEDAWVRVVLWGGGAAPAGLDGQQGGPGAGYVQCQKRTYRVAMLDGESLRIRVGGRPTKSVVGASPTWETAGDQDEFADGRLQVGGYPDGGDGIEQDVTLMEGWTPEFMDGEMYPCCTVTVNFRVNGGGGSSRVWLRGLDNVEKLVIVEPGQSHSSTSLAFGSVTHSSGGWALLDGTVTGFPERGNYYHYFRTAGSNLRGDLPFPDPDVGVDDLPPQNWLDVREDHGPSGTPEPAGMTARPLPPSLGGVYSTGPSRSYAFRDGRIGAHGGPARGADAQFTALGPTSSGGGGWGGGCGGPALLRSAGGTTGGPPSSGYPDPTNSAYRDDIGSEPGHPGGRWWADDLVEQVDVPYPVVDDADRLFLPANLEDLVTEPGQFFGPVPYYETPWLFGFGAAWVCPEVPVEDEVAWSVGDLAAGRLAGVSTNLAGIVQAAVDD